MSSRNADFELLTRELRALRLLMEQDEPPATPQDILVMRRVSGLPLKRFFNTSGQRYRELALKEKLPAMPQDEQLALLASDGMLVKRPVLAGEDFVLVGFRPAEWETVLLK